MHAPWSRVSALMSTIAGVVMLLVGAPASARTGASAGDCWRGLAPALKAGGFAAYAECSEGGVDLRYAGHTKPYRGRSYHVYSLISTFGGENGTAVHANQRILIFDSARRYLGEYRIDTPPFHRIWVSGFDVRIDGRAGRGDRISLKAVRPPDGAMVAQDYSAFQP